MCAKTAVCTIPLAFIQHNLNRYTVSQLCGALRFPRSTYYKAFVRVPSDRQKEYEAFGRKVKQVYDDSRQRYGSVKICYALKDDETPCSIKPGTAAWNRDCARLW